MEGNEWHVRAFVRDLKSRNLAPTTIASYLDSLTQLRTFLNDTDLSETTRDQMRAFFADQLERYAPATAAIRYRSLQQFFKWARAEDIRSDDPMAGMSPPTVPVQPVAVLTLDDVKALLKVCGDKSFVGRRDEALFRLFLEPGGMRLSEMVGIGLGDIDLSADRVTIMGKGRRARNVWFGSKTGTALDRYMRLRQQHPHRKLDALWLGPKGALTVSGVAQMMRRRAVQAGLPHLHPHMLRHTAAHEWLSAGGQETDALALFGWRSREMLGRYGASAAAARAEDASKRMKLGDRY